ncbi:tape measure protein [Dermabacteraceae bacterium P13077]
MAANGPELGVAYLSLVPSLKGATRSIESQLGKAETEIARKGNFGGALFGTLKKGAVVAGAGIVSILGASLWKGFGRLSAIENAQAKLRGLGHDAKSITQIMKDSLAAVKGTAYGLEEAATVSAVMVASGIKPGKELEKTLRLVADSATISGQSMSDMGRIWASVAARGKLQGDDAMQLMSAGIPIWQMLGKEMNVTAGQAQELASKGKVSFETFRVAMEKNLGGAAKESGNTVTGSFKNMLAALGRFGAGLVGIIYPVLQPAFKKITGWIDGLTKAVEPAGKAITETFGGLGKALLQKLMPAFKDISAWMHGTGIPAFLELKEAASGIWDILYKGDYTGGIFGIQEDEALVTFLFDLRNAGIALWDKFLAPVAQWVSENGKPIMAFLVGFTATLAGSVLISAAIAIGTTLAGALAAVAAAVFSIPVAIAAVVGALTWFFTQTKIGQKIFAGLVDIISAAFTWLVDTAIPFVRNGVEGLITFISGSFSSAREAITGFFTGLHEAIAGTFKDAYEGISGFFTGIRGAISDAVSWITETANLLWAGLTMDSETRAEFDGQLEGFVAFGAGLRAVFDAVIDFFTGTVVGAIKTAFQALSDAALWLWKQVIEPVWTGIKIAVAAVITVVVLLIKGLVALWKNVLAPAAIWLWQNVLAPAWDGIKNAVEAAVSAVAGFVSDLVSLWRGTLATATTWLWKNVMGPAWSGIQAVINAVVTWFTGTVVPAYTRALQVISEIFTRFWLGVIKPVWNGILNAIQAVVSWFERAAVGAFQAATRAVFAAFDWLRANALRIWNNVQAAIRAVVDWFAATAVGAFRAATQAVSAAFNFLRSSIAAVWDAVRSKIVAPVVNWFKDSVVGTFYRSLDAIKNAFAKTKDGIAKVWDGLRSALRKPVSAVINTVVKPVADTYDKVAAVVGAPQIGLNPKTFGFARGGILPGYSPGVDDYHFIDPRRGISLNLAGGEPIMRPEFGRAVGKSWVDRMNALARTGGASAVKREMGFARGGIFPGGSFAAAGGAFDWIKAKYRGAKDWLSKAWGSLTDFIENPARAFTAVKDRLLGAVNIPANGLGSMLKNMVSNVAKGAISTITGSAGGIDSTGVGARLGANVLPLAGKRLTSLAQILALPRFGTSVTSTVRPGARTANGGFVSLHALGKAADFAGPPAAMRKFFAYVRSHYVPSELIHTPMGGAQLSRGGRPRARFAPVTERMHYNHVHVGAFNRGGVFNPPGLYDQGGLLRPGVTAVTNKTGKPEAVLTADQWGQVRRLVRAVDEQVGGAGIGTLNINLSLDDLKNLADLEAFMRMLRVHARMQGGVTV